MSSTFTVLIFTDCPLFPLNAGDELNEDRDLNVIDIGTNVGQFCLSTALLGRRCIGIDVIFPVNPICHLLLLC
jgi:hypothetical protein